jgi:hypothetical protein
MPARERCIITALRHEVEEANAEGSLTGFLLVTFDHGMSRVRAIALPDEEFGQMVITDFCDALLGDDPADAKDEIGPAQGCA